MNKRIEEFKDLLKMVKPERLNKYGLMVFKEINVLLDYINQLETNRDELKKWLEEEKDRLVRECSNIYEDSLGKTKLVSEDIFNELTKVSEKIDELERGKDNG